MPKRAMLGTILVASVIIAFAVYLGSTQVYGVPAWWIFRNIIPLSSLQPGTLGDTITPISPNQIGEHETATVVDVTTKQPLAAVNVSVYYGGGLVFVTQTNSEGVALFSYAGSPTIVDFSKEGYISRMEVLPNAPEAWVNRNNWSALWGGLSFLVALTSLSVQVKALKLKGRSRGQKRKSN